MVSGLTTNERLSLCFKGDNRMDVALLGQALLDMATIVDEISSLDGDKTQFRVQVVAVEFGSFDVVLDLICKAADTIVPLLTIENALVAATLIKTIFEIKKHLKGDKPKFLETVGRETAVVLEDGTIIKGAGLEILRSERLDRAVSDISQISMRHDSNQGFSIKDGQSEVFFTPEDARSIAIQQKSFISIDKNAEGAERLSLPIKSVDLLGNSSWKFKYGTRSISAKIDDEGFIDAVHAGKVSVQAGDKLDVDLVTSIKKSPEGEVISENYRISCVYGLVPPRHHEQMKI